MKALNFFFCGCLAVALLTFAFPLVKGTVMGASQVNYLTGATQSTSSVTTSWVNIGAAGNRQWTIVSNFGSVPLYLNFGSTSTASTGVIVPASTTFTIDLDHLYVGNIYAITGSGTDVVSVLNFK